MYKSTQPTAYSPCCLSGKRNGKTRHLQTRTKERVRQSSDHISYAVAARSHLQQEGKGDRNADHRNSCTLLQTTDLHRECHVEEAQLPTDPIKTDMLQQTYAQCNRCSSGVVMGDQAVQKDRHRCDLQRTAKAAQDRLQELDSHFVVRTQRRNLSKRSPLMSLTGFPSTGARDNFALPLTPCVRPQRPRPRF